MIIKLLIVVFNFDEIVILVLKCWERFIKWRLEYLCKEFLICWVVLFFEVLLININL